MGWRTTAQNLNLNRDYLKADAPEMSAMLGLIRKVDPALYLDLHVTDGIDYNMTSPTAFRLERDMPARRPSAAGSTRGFARRCSRR